MFRHGSIMVIAAMLMGFLNYLYQLSMGMMLTSEQYGTIYSLLALISIISILSQGVQISVIKFVSEFRTQNDLSNVNYVWSYFIKRSTLAGVALCLILFLLTPIISEFLHINNDWYLIILFSSLIVSFALPVNFGVMLGLQRFMHFATSGVLIAAIKLALAILLVHIGFEIHGALLPILLSALCVFGITAYLIRDVLRAGNASEGINGLSSYAGFALLCTACFTVLVNIDAFLVRHYLDSDSAGNYAAISVLGKIALILPIGIVMAMFPKTAELARTGGDHRSILAKAVFFMLLLSSPVVIAYWVIPEFTADLLFGDKYPLAANQLFKYSLAMALFAHSFLIVNYILSLGKTKVTYPVIGLAIAELLLIMAFHSDITQVVDMMLISGVVCFVTVLISYFALARQKDY